MLLLLFFIFLLLFFIGPLMVQTGTAVAGELDLEGRERGMDKVVKYGEPVGGRVHTRPDKSIFIASKAANFPTRTDSDSKLKKEECQKPV